MPGTSLHLGLTTKLSLLVTATVLLALAVLGFRFDLFLQQNFLENTRERMQHAHSRLAATLRETEQQLRDGVSFVRSDDRLIASVQLINNYQDKSDYNTFLIDEEKKTLAEALLDRVKLSFNHDITLFDQNQELIALVTKDVNLYRAFFYTYARGKRQLLSRNDQQAEFLPWVSALPRGVITLHAPYYPDSQVFNSSVITYHRLDDSLVMKSHQDLVEPTSGKVIGHIELSHHFDKDFFARLSTDLGIDLGLSFSPELQLISTPLPLGGQTPALQVHESEEEYLSVMEIDTANAGSAFFVSRLDKHLLHRALNQNRGDFAVLVTLVAVATLLMMRWLIRGGLARPLKQLMEQINRVERGEYTAITELRTRDELEAISASVNQLATSLREREFSLELSRQELRYLSDHDPLTDLPNRRLFADRLEHALALARRNQQLLAIFFIDLDQFKEVNDTLGHDVGDELLVQVAKRLGLHTRNSDTLARIGGDEFNILVENPRDLHELEVVVSKYLELFNTSFNCKGQSINTSASIGISLYPKDGDDSITLIKHADLAMYKAKSSGRNRYSFFSNELSEQVLQRAELSQAMIMAIEVGDQFQLHYQPKVSTASGRMVAVEALIRWQRPGIGMVSPLSFIPLAEENGLIVPIGEWVLRQACRDFVRLREEGIPLEHVSVNLSNVQLRHADVLALIRGVLDETGIPPGALELEITESFIATDIEHAIQTLAALRGMGLHLAVDDFGTGYSSMSYLQKLPVTRIKVDKSFVDELPHNRDSCALTHAIIQLARSFNLQVTAEGVENTEQLHFLEKEGCDEIQGYYYSRPLPLGELRQYHWSREHPDKVITFNRVRDRKPGA